MKSLSFKIVVALLIFAIGSVGWVTVFGRRGWLAYRHLVQVKMEMEDRVSRLEEENRILAHEIYRLKHDKDYLERIVRQQLDVGKPDELVFKFKSHQ